MAQAGSFSNAASVCGVNLSASSSSNGAAASCSAFGSADASFTMAAEFALASIALTRLASARKIGADFSKAVISLVANADPPENDGGSNGFNFPAVSLKIDPKLPYSFTSPALILVGSLEARLVAVVLVCPTMGVKPVQKADSQAALCASSPAELLPTVVVGSFDELDVLDALDAVPELLSSLLVVASLDAVSLDAVSLEAAELDGSVMLAAAELDGAPLEEA